LAFPKWRACSSSPATRCVTAPLFEVEFGRHKKAHAQSDSAPSRHVVIWYRHSNGRRADGLQNGGLVSHPFESDRLHDGQPDRRFASQARVCGVHRGAVPLTNTTKAAITQWCPRGIDTAPEGRRVARVFKPRH